MPYCTKTKRIHRRKRKGMRNMRSFNDGKEEALREAMRMVQKGIDLQEISLILRKEIINDFVNISEENKDKEFKKGKLRTKKEIYSIVEKFIKNKDSIEEFKDFLESWIIEEVEGLGTSKC